MDKILDEFKNWPDKITNLSCIALTAEKPPFDCHQHNLFSFDWT